MAPYRNTRTQIARVATATQSTRNNQTTENIQSALTDQTAPAAQTDPSESSTAAPRATRPTRRRQQPRAPSPNPEPSENAERELPAPSSRAESLQPGEHFEETLLGFPLKCVAAAIAGITVSSLCATLATGPGRGVGSFRQVFVVILVYVLVYLLSIALWLRMWLWLFLISVLLGLTGRSLTPQWRQGRWLTMAWVLLVVVETANGIFEYFRCWNDLRMGAVVAGSCFAWVRSLYSQ